MHIYQSCLVKISMTVILAGVFIPQSAGGGNTAAAENQKIINHVITVASSGVKGKDADFIGIAGLQEAVNSIKDNSATNQYEIRLSGLFRAGINDFLDCNIDQQKAIIPQKEYVTISGRNRNEDGIVAVFADNLDINYRHYNIIVSSVSMTLKNLTLRVKNLRYPLHIYGGSAPGKKFVLENCIVRHEGNTGKALSEWSQPRPIGVGLSSNFHFIVRNCDIYSEQISPVNHGSNQPFIQPASVLYENSRIETGKNLHALVWLYSQGSGKINTISLLNTSGSGTVGIGEGVWTSGRLEDQLADHNEFDLLMPDTPPQPYTYTSKGLALKIESGSKGKHSAVRFDETSDAFPLIVGNPGQKNESVNRYGFAQQYGYSYRDGGNELPGFAMGTLSLQEDPLKFHKGIYISSLGKRLGNCSVTRKTLRIIIDGKSYEIIFDKNYDGQDKNSPPKFDNAAILAEIKAVIGAVATVTMYDPGTEYYPKFKGGVTLRNGDVSAVYSGMGVVFTGQGMFRKASNADGKIDGICLDDGRVGDSCRIITSGEIWSGAKKCRFSTRECINAQRNPGDRLGISKTEPGVFDAQATPAVLVATRKNVLAFIK